MNISIMGTTGVITLISGMKTDIGMATKEILFVKLLFAIGGH